MLLTWGYSCLPLNRRSRRRLFLRDVSCYCRAPSGSPFRVVNMHPMRNENKQTKIFHIYLTNHRIIYNPKAFLIRFLSVLRSSQMQTKNKRKQTHVWKGKIERDDEELEILLSECGKDWLGVYIPISWDWMRYGEYDVWLCVLRSWPGTVSKRVNINEIISSCQAGQCSGNL